MFKLLKNGRCLPLKFRFGMNIFKTQVKYFSSDLNDYKDYKDYKINDAQRRFLKNVAQNTIEYEEKLGTMNRVPETKVGNKMEFMSKALRRTYLNRGVYSNNKHIIPIKRLRTESDTLLKTFKNGDLVGVIHGREEFPDLNFIVDRKYLSGLTKR